MPAVDRPLQATVLAATRSCWASGVEAAEWAGFVREAARRDAGEKTRGEGSSKATTDGLAEEASLGETVCGTSASVLIEQGLTPDFGPGAILELLESSPSTAPRLLLYLHEALVTPIGSEPLSSPNEAALAVLRRCETVEADRSEPALYALDRLSTALLAHPVPPSLATASPKIALARLIRLLDLHHLLSTSAEVSGVGRPTILLAQLLLPTLAASVRSLRRRSFDGIAEARDAAVEKLSQALLSPPPFVDLGQLAALLRHLSPSTARSLAFEHADPSQATHEEISISASAVIAHLLLTPGSIAATETASGRLEAFARLHIDRKPDTSWTAEILFATATMGPTSPDLEDAVWTAFLAGGRLCELLELTAKRLDASPAQRLSSADLARLKSLLLMEALSTGLEPEQTSSEDFKASKEAVWATLLSQLRRSGLVSSDDDAEMAETSDQVLPYEQALSSLRQTLPQAPGDDSVGALAASTVETLASAASPSSVDLGLLCSLTEALGAAETQAVLLLWVSPASLLGPVRRVLDGWNDDGWGAAGQEGAGFEQFGQLLGFIQGIVGRFGLRDDLAAHLGSTSGFTAQHLLAPGSSYSLSALSPPQRQTLASWIDALYGNSGISDDLLTGTDPRMLVQLAPTVFRQSFEALRVGVMDAENIKEGLSYFEQGLLGGCAVGVMSWLVDELSRVEYVGALSASPDLHADETSQAFACAKLRGDDGDTTVADPVEHHPSCRRRADSGKDAPLDPFHTSSPLVSRPEPPGRRGAPHIVRTEHHLTTRFAGGWRRCARLG